MKKSNLMLSFAICSLLAVTANAANDDAIIRRARELQLAKKYDEAVKFYEAHLKNNASERLYADYATLLINLKKYDECDTVLTKAVTSFPNSLRIKNALGTAKFKKGNLSEASSLFSQVLSKDSENKYAKTMLESIRKAKSSAGLLGGTGSNSNNNSDSDFSNNSYSGGITFKVSDKLSLDEQKELAKKLYEEMISLDKWATDDFINLHKQVIEKCPLTDQAQESCWRLSNLFLLGTDNPEYENCIACLEHLLKQYPDTPLMPDAKNRLISVCQKAGEFEKVCQLYEELFKLDPEPDNKIFMIRALEYGNALAACGKTEDAKVWYGAVLEKDNGKNSLEARAANKKLSEL